MPNQLKISIDVRVLKNSLIANAAEMLEVRTYHCRNTILRLYNVVSTNYYESRLYARNCGIIFRLTKHRFIKRNISKYSIDDKILDYVFVFIILNI